MSSRQSPVNGTLPRKSPRNLESKPSPYSLQENGNEEPSCVKTYDPNFCDKKHLRRSTRFISTPFVTGDGSKKLKVDLEEMKSSDFSPSVIQNSLSFGASGSKIWYAMCLRRSPRLSSSNSVQPEKRFLASTGEMKSPELSLSVIENSVSLRAADLKLLDDKYLRRSPRLSSFKPVQLLTSSGKMKSPELSLSVIEKPVSSTDDKCLRRSPRLKLSNSVQPQQRSFTSSQSSENGNAAKIVSFRKSNVTTLDENCLRSPTLSSSQIKDESSKPMFPWSESSFSFEKQPCKEVLLSTYSEDKHIQYKRASFFIGDPIPENESQERWPWRYELKNKRFKGQGFTLKGKDDEEEIVTNVKCHYAQAKFNGTIFNLGDCTCIKVLYPQPKGNGNKTAFSIYYVRVLSCRMKIVALQLKILAIKAPAFIILGEGEQNHVGRILEFFKTTEGEDYFRVQWFFRAEETVMKEEAAFHDKKRLFHSTTMDDNLLDCIISKVNVIQISLKPELIPPCDYYYDMEYSVEYSTFHTLLTAANTTSPEDMPGCRPDKSELALLDLYSGCGGMSTGLCLGSKRSCVNLVTKWALDFNKSACESLKLNHPETQIRNETAEDFLNLLKEWEKLCKRYAVNHEERKFQSRSNVLSTERSNINSLLDIGASNNEFEVLKLVDICYGDPSDTGKRGLKFKVRWKGYGPSEDTWEPLEGLSNCQEGISDFVRSGLKSKILPLPGDVDVICGGPPCQGISGYNRFRNVDSPLSDERNHQIVILMDTVEFLKPKYVLMENVVDLLKLDNASLGRYAISRLVHMKYQARLGMIAAGCYGLPQFRLRVFLWGAHPGESLPQFPLPTHDVVAKYWPPSEFERNIVAYDENQPRELGKALVLRDAISDLPAVSNHETREKMPYEKSPETEFQKYVRLTQEEVVGSASNAVRKRKKSILYDHRPHSMNEDNYLRVCQIPRRKGANFRDLPGVIVGSDNVALRDSTMKRILLPSGHPLVPDCVFSYEQGKSKRPFARLWWDETVPTVLTFPNIRSQAVLHPEQDRLLTIREFARLQGFPDYYRFCGTVKERYCQIGNAVAVPVGRALGYTLGMAHRKLCGNEPLTTLPPHFFH